MAEPSFLSNGDTPTRRDTKWFRWTRILGQFQNRSGANPDHNPRRNDSLWQIKQRVLKAINDL